MTEKREKEKPVFVLKIGGDIVADPVALRTMAEQVRAHQRRERSVVLVVSAPRGATPILRNLVQELKRNAHDRKDETASSEEVKRLKNTFVGLYKDWIMRLGVTDVHDRINPAVDELFRDASSAAGEYSYTPILGDRILALGEQTAVEVVGAFFEKMSFLPQVVRVWEAGLLTDANFGAAHPLEAAGEMLRGRISSILQQGLLAIVPGFVGHDADGRVTTLGPSGSDYTATTMARAFRDGEVVVEVWKRFELHTADPKLVKGAKPIPLLSHRQAQELAGNGLGALHPAAMEPLEGTSIVVYVKNVDQPARTGTKISPTIGSRAPAGITLTRGHHLLTVQTGAMFDVAGFVAAAATVLAKRDLSIGLTATGETRLSFSTKGSVGEIGEAMKEIAVKATVRDEGSCAVLTVVGGVKGLNRQTLTRIMEALAKSAKVLSFSMAGAGYDWPADADPLSCQIVVRNRDAERALRAVHRALYNKPCNKHGKPA